MMLALAMVVAKSSLVLAMAWCAARALTRGPAALRHAVWLTAVLAVLCVPVVDRVARVSLPILPALHTVPPPSLPTPSSSALGGEEPSTPVTGWTAASPPSALAERDRWAARPSLAQTLLAAWLAIAASLVVRLVAGALSVSRLARRGRVLASAEWLHALSDAASRVGVRELPRLVMSDEVEVAFAFGVRSPAIVVPASAREWSTDRRRSVLLHELAHVRRRDLVGHWVAGLACAASWFNPLVWIAARELRIESEKASDEMVLSAGVRPSAYAQHLLDLVTSVRHRAPRVAMAMARPKEFEGRLVAILDPVQRTAAARRQRVAIVALVALIAASIGAVAPARRTSQTIVASPASPSLTSTPRVGTDRPNQSRIVIPVRRTPAVAPNHSVARRALSPNAVASLMRFGTGGIVNPMLMVLRIGDSLRLTGVQADSIATLNRQYMIRLSAIWSPVSAYYAAHPDADARRIVAGEDPSRATARALAGLLPELEGVLTSEQRAAVPSTISPFLDPRSIDAAVARSADGVFLSGDQLFALRGRGRGGG